MENSPFISQVSIRAHLLLSTVNGIHDLLIVHSWSFTEMQFCPSCTCPRWNYSWHLFTGYWWPCIGTQFVLVTQWPRKGGRKVGFWLQHDNLDKTPNSLNLCFPNSQYFPSFSLNALRIFSTWRVKHDLLWYMPGYNHIISFCSTIHIKQIPRHCYKRMSVLPHFSWKSLYFKRETAKFFLLLKLYSLRDFFSTKTCEPTLYLLEEKRTYYMKVRTSLTRNLFLMFWSII